MWGVEEEEERVLRGNIVLLAEILTRCILTLSPSILQMHVWEILFLQSTCVYNCAWLPLRPYPNDDPGHCEMRNLCHQATAQWRRSD